jgi:drug/metabolite transporter (DMT)-like permease
MNTRAWTAFAAVSLLWGIPYALIKVTVDDGVPPAFVAWSRIALGAVVLLGLAWRAGTLGQLRGRVRPLVAFAFAEITVPFPLIAFGEAHVSSSLAAIVVAACPLFVVVLALRFDRAERPGGTRLAGLACGFAGVVALVGIDVAGSAAQLLGAGAILVACLGYAVGPMVLKRHLADVDPFASMGASLLVAAVALAPAVALDPPTAVPSTAALGSLVALGLLCTAAGLVLYGVLVTEAGPGRALVVTYVNPVVAVALGAAVLGERPGPGALVGLALVLAGSWLSTDGRMPRLRRRLALAPSAG